MASSADISPLVLFAETPLFFMIIYTFSRSDVQSAHLWCASIITRRPHPWSEIIYIRYFQSQKVRTTVRTFLRARGYVCMFTRCATANPPDQEVGERGRVKRILIRRVYLGLPVCVVRNPFSFFFFVGYRVGNRAQPSSTERERGGER